MQFKVSFHKITSFYYLNLLFQLSGENIEDFKEINAQKVLKF